MTLDRKKIEKAVEAALAQKSERKFKQSIDLAVNFRDIDFKKPENRINLDVVLPHPPKEVKVAVFADGQLALDAKKVADLVISGAEIPGFASDKAKQKQLLSYSLLASTQLMPVVAKNLGQFLGTKGKVPKPILPNANLAELVKKTKQSITVKNKGKFLPCVHCLIGREDMSKEQITDNAFAVLEAITHKVPESQVASVYIKSTMGKPAKV
ncbi:MAG: 50S ribosomal protein L1 [Candidatus Micrarchaeia archaeon]